MHMVSTVLYMSRNMTLWCGSLKSVLWGGMDWIVGLLIVVGIGWWLLRPKRSAAPESIAVNRLQPKPPVYEDYQDELERKPIEELDEEEQIIRRAHDAFMAERDNRNAEYRAKTAALAVDEKKIARATDFIKTSYLSHALPFVQDETQHWPSWSKMGEGHWKAPVPLSDVDGSTTGGIDEKWVQFRADGGSLYKIEFERSRMPVDDDYEYASMTLSVDGEEVLGMFVKRDWTKEWATWQFSIVESLKIGPWIEGFMAFYNRLRSINENEAEDRNGDYVRQQAAKIDLGGAQ